MKETQLTKATNEVVALKLKAIDLVTAEMIQPLAELGSPEQLIAKPYDTWTPADLQVLASIYGSGDDTALAKVIFNREYEKVKTLENEVE